MKIPQIIEIDLNKFYYDSLKKIVNAYRYDNIDTVENEILNFLDTYELLIGELDEKGERHG